LREEIIEQADKVKAAEAMLLQAVKADAGCRLLMSIPNIGPINAAALSVALEAPGVFARGRAFAAYLRLVPRQQASADSARCTASARCAPVRCAPTWCSPPKPC
ncbi:MAG TPA: transposase, partial [Stellaceae bacterium]|nr:transposase [Stellaceae bacterium]